MRCLLATGRAAVSICEIDKARREEVLGRYGVEHAFDSAAAARRRRWDAIVVATPADTHVPLALELAESASNLFIEKPLSTSLEGIDRLAALVDSGRVSVSVAYVYRAHPALASMKTAIDEGRFGEPIQITVTSGQHFPMYRPAFAATYYRNRATGGGAIQDALTHFFNAAEWLVGPIDRVAADAAHMRLEGVDVEDTVVAITRHGRVLGSFSLNQHQAPNETTLTVVCERGTARLEVHKARWLWVTGPAEPWQEEGFGPMERDTWFTRQENLFLDALEGKRKPLCSLAEAIHTLKVNLAALQSVQNGSEPVAIDDRS